MLGSTEKEEYALIKLPDGRVINTKKENILNHISKIQEMEITEGTPPSMD